MQSIVAHISKIEARFKNRAIRRSALIFTESIPPSVVARRDANEFAEDTREIITVIESDR